MNDNDTVKKTEKIDKGFCLFYWKLSYRRKFIRTLWTIPYAVIVIVLILMAERHLDAFRFPFPGLGTNGFIILIIFVSVFQLVYNYIRWKREQAERQK